MRKKYWVQPANSGAKFWHGTRAEVLVGGQLVIYDGDEFVVVYNRSEWNVCELYTIG